jgi:hypothetical protein
MTLRDGTGALRGAVRAPADANGGPPKVSAEAVTWALKLFAGRDPVDAAEIRFHQGHLSLDGLRTAFAQTAEFRTFYATVAKPTKARFGVPPTMLRPSPEGIGWRLEPPSIDHPVCQLCTATQFREPVFAEIIQALGAAPRLSRRVWEQVYVVAVLADQGCIEPGRTAIGLGVERERVAALLASRGVQVTALGQTGRLPELQTKGGLHLFYPEVGPLAGFETLVSYNEAPLGVGGAELTALLGGPWDMVWSCGAAQRSGGIAEALDFIERSMELLRPGGFAVHTLDFNIGSEEETVETEELSVPRRADIEALLLRLVAAGHQVAPLNLYPGHEPEDGSVDVQPYSLPHLKAEVEGHVVTSLGLLLQKAG